ncbi:MAG: type II toxin-antitoxin system RelE/ParE family toxin [Candidatus Thiodiazotropha sp. (ex Dulcina madagascariensis)]|nr:type II toxin-antitoxin system RelE/ParE family toxin [Candidatus Thiodiazotropha sp. (ex Dulcina madagascariensis)]
MTWNVEWDDRARRELRQLDRQVQRTILRYFSERIATDDDPCRFGKPLRHELQGLWRYRIGDYRAICQIENDKLVVLVLAVNHRRQVYR